MKAHQIHTTRRRWVPDQSLVSAIQEFFAAFPIIDIHPRVMFQAGQQWKLSLQHSSAYIHTGSASFGLLKRTPNLQTGQSRRLFIVKKKRKKMHLSDLWAGRP
jgi:hypothetical protein